MIFMRYPQTNTQLHMFLLKNRSNNTSQVYLYQIFVKDIHRNGPCIAFWPILSLRDILNEMEWAWIKILLSPDVSVCAKHFVRKCEKSISVLLEFGNVGHLCWEQHICQCVPQFSPSALLKFICSCLAFKIFKSRMHPEQKYHSIQ